MLRIMDKTVEVKSGKLSKEQEKTLRSMKDRPIVYDEDLPAFTKEQLKQFRRVSETKKSERVKQTVSLRLSPATLQKAKSLGKGYTGVLSRLLDLALNDPEMVKRAL